MKKPAQEFTAAEVIPGKIMLRAEIDPLVQKLFLCGSSSWQFFI